MSVGGRSLAYQGKFFKEWLVLGRTPHGENMVGGHITDSWRVKKDDRLIWADSFRITDEIFLRDCSRAGS
jgi:urease accessory protein